MIPTSIRFDVAGVSAATSCLSGKGITINTNTAGVSTIKPRR
ncbi:Uncharacterised protein [Vibrio cholerae]|nr:Uncharacterised protein [Vibrio cholerae]